MKNKILITALSLVLVAGLVGGGTAAWFTDSATNLGNTFTAGTVEIEVTRESDPVPGPMFYATQAQGTMPGQDPDDVDAATGVWYPGRPAVTRLLNVRNTGSLAARIHAISATITAAGPNDTALLRNAWANAMWVRVYHSPGRTTQVLFNGPLATLLATDPTPAMTWRPPVFPGGAVHLAFEVSMLTTAGNNLQGFSPVVSFTVHVEQTAGNPHINQYTNIP